MICFSWKVTNHVKCTNYAQVSYFVHFAHLWQQYIYRRSLTTIINLELLTGPFLICLFVCLFWCLTSQSTAMAMSGRSVHLTTLFSWASLTKRLTSTLCTYFPLYLTTTLLESAEGRRMALEIISWSISSKVWDWAVIKLMTPGSAVRHITDCAMRPGGPFLNI